MSTTNRWASSGLSQRRNLCRARTACNRRSSLSSSKVNGTCTSVAAGGSGWLELSATTGVSVSGEGASSASKTQLLVLLLP